MREESERAPAVSQEEYTRAILNVLEDFSSEKERFGDTQRAILNILDDYGAEKAALQSTQRALLNILDDFGGEKARLEATQKAMLNLLEDFDAEKSKAQASNMDLTREIAERKQAEAELREKSAALGRSNAELEQFAYVASHDLQEPLRMVSSYMQLFAARYSGAVDAQADQYIRYAVEGAKRMQALIGGLLEYSRVGRQTVVGRVEAGVALDLALKNLESAIVETRAKITHDPLPAVRADAGQLMQVFQNLVGNAIKFRRAGEPPIVHVGVRQDEDQYVFTVKDNGIGIDPRHADRIFVIFQRLHTRAEYPGTGIGLSICKKVVERHGGRIWVESEGDDGSAFHFTLGVPHAD